MKIDRKNPSHWLALLRFSAVTIYAFILHKFNRRTPEKPIILLYGHKLNSNLKALYLKLEETDTYNYYFLSMDSKYVRKLRDDKVKVLNGCELSSARIIANCSVIVTDHGLHCLELFLCRSEIKFMDVWHGIPFKGFTPEDFKILHRYNAVCVTSEYLREIYIQKFGFEPDKIKITGYGRTDLTLSTNTKLDYQKNNLQKSNKTIITYAPTWKQDKKDRSIIPFEMKDHIFFEEIDKLCNKINGIFIFRTHLNSHTRIANYKYIAYRPHHIYEDTESLLRITDILITDWSSIYFDFIPLKRPVILVDSKPPFKKGLSIPNDYRVGIPTKSIEALKSTISDEEYLKPIWNREYEKPLKQVYGWTLDLNASKRYMKIISSLLTPP